MRWLFLFLFLALPAAGQEIVAGLSQNRISISTTFNGSEILIFGAIKREAPADAEETGVIITVEGPYRQQTVRRKERVGPIWINVDAVEIDSAPSFYAVNTSAPLETVLSHTADLRHEITVRQAIRSVGAPVGITDSPAFTEALIRIREEGGLYQMNGNAVTLQEGTLFNTSVALPANLVEGVYVSRIFLTRDGQVIAESSETIYVEMVGIERFLYNLAHEQALLYGLLSLAIAIAAGWGASAVFRYIQS